MAHSGLRQLGWSEGLTLEVQDGEQEPDAPGLEGQAEGGHQGLTHSPQHAAIALTKPERDHEERRRWVVQQHKGGERAGESEAGGLGRNYFHHTF